MTCDRTMYDTLAGPMTAATVATIVLYSVADLRGLPEIISIPDGVDTVARQ